jgi:alpha-N-arabinofuranosidase
MSAYSRREFVKTAAIAGVAATAECRFPAGLLAQSATAGDATPCRVYLDPRRTLPALERDLFGSFLEHLGRAIYQGIYEPGSKLSNADGFRTDVLEEVRKLGVPIIRYPGGNFVSGYHWLDGVGSKAERPRVLDKAWNTIDTNQFGLNEFMAWSKLAGSEALLGLNLGTGTPEMAAALVEYCNIDKGTRWSELRRKHGVAEPYKIKKWCLGNEMDGPWQIGHMPAAEYGEKAADAAREMRYVDPEVTLVACGSSGPGMATYLEWDREVLEQCYEYVDAISLHRYFANTVEETGGDSGKFLALSLTMDKQIAEVAAVCDVVRGHKRSAKKLWLSFDEWNVWYHKRTTEDMNGHGGEAPHLIEDIYTLEDALLVGGLVNSLLRNSDRVRVACLAQLVNVIAPIMTNAGGLFRQTIFYPYSWGLQYARGAALQLLIEGAQTYDVSGMGAVPYLDVVGTANAADGSTALFVLNRDLARAQSFEVHWEDRAAGRLLAAQVLTGTDLKAVNGFDAPSRVTPMAAEKPVMSAGRMQIEVPARSYSVFQWGG